ncbi:MAG: trehalose-phosphatase [Elusimicrobia bacterium RBG_16_66_12]|nr:MAG: trehalose-phosphatase [Elusimicrobia bacterium RBG_16_66_12]
MSVRRLVALDLDGTLAPLRRDPAAVRLTAARRALLARLGRSPDIRVLVVSGRPQGFLRRALAGTGAALAGEHGWVLEGIGPRWRHPRLSLRARQARALAAAARRAVRGFKGVRVETKTSAVAVHWRSAPRVIRDPSGLRRVLTALLPAGWRLAGGKRIWEFRPADAWGKGEVIALAARRLRARVVFIGDDVTDEEAFRTLGRGARTVKVGPGPTRARERVGGLSGVDALLDRLAR